MNDPAMNDIDALITRIRDLPVDPRIEGIDDAVIVGLARRLQSQVSIRAVAVVTLVSLGVGIAGSVFPAQPVQAASLFPLGAPAALAPSTLLGTKP